MTTIITRVASGPGATTVKGALLTATEVDTNFMNLNVAKLECDSNGSLLLPATTSAELAPAISAGSWTLGTGWSISSGQLIKTAGAVSNASPATPITVTAGKTYKVVITVSASTIGNNYLYYTIGGVSGSRLDPGTVTDYIVATTTGNLTFVDVSVSESCTITSISVKELVSTSGNLTIDGALTVRSLTKFTNPVTFGLAAPTTAPVVIMTSNSEGLRIYRNQNTSQYISINESDGSAHQIVTVGDKQLSIIHGATTQPIVFNINSATRLTLDALGNIGQNVTPSAWGSAYRAYQIGSTSALYNQSSTTTVLSNNSYFNGTNNLFLTTGTANQISLGSGVFKFSSSPSGTGGGTITYDRVTTLDNAGNIGMNVTPSAWEATFKVIESGGSFFTSSIGFQTNASAINLFTNTYFDGTNYRYVRSATAGRYQLVDNTHTWYNVVSGTAGNAISWNVGMSLDASSNLGIGGSLTFAGSTKRIYADFQGTGTVASRFMFQNSTTNIGTAVGAIPNGTATTASYSVFNNSDPDNSSYGGFRVDSSTVQINSDKLGTGTVLPIALNVGGVARLRIETSGNVFVTSAAGFGYGSGYGAGGTVTQATSKSTTVTLNNPTGKITLANDTLNAGATAIFQFNNSILAATDTITLTVIGASNMSSYNVWAGNGGAGFTYIAIKNISGSNLTESFSIQYNIHKGAIS